MGAIRRICTWLSDIKHQKTIALWVGVLGLVLGAAWKLSDEKKAVFNHFSTIVCKGRFE